MDIEQFVSQVLHEFALSITDKVFLLIQNDPEIMREYLHLIEKKGVRAVNTYIGKAVKKRFDLTDVPEREITPKSTLILSHQKFD